MQGPLAAYASAAILYALLVIGSTPVAWNLIIRPEATASTVTKGFSLDPARLRFAVGLSVWLEFVFFAAQGILWSVTTSPGHFQKSSIKKSHVKYPERTQIWHCIKDIALGHMFRPFFLWFSYPLLHVCGVALSTNQYHKAKRTGYLGSFQDAMTPQGILTHLLACVLIGDTVFYWGHRYLHENKWLYNTVHKKHHEFKYVVGVATEYSHPVEDLFVNTASGIAGPLLLGSPVWVLAGHLGILLAQSIDAHGGLDLRFPLSCWNMLPYSDCAVAHDFHHSNNVGNYGGFFSFWDHAMGTDVHYKKHLAKLQKGTSRPN